MLKEGFNNHASKTPIAYRKRLKNSKTRPRTRRRGDFGLSAARVL
jgi:hypothetical protein